MQRLADRPELDMVSMVSMETSDGPNHCECEACPKLGSVSGRALGLVNEAARDQDRTFTALRLAIGGERW